MQPRELAWLGDIVECATLIASYLAEGTREQFLASIGQQDKVIRRLEIIGEAARRLSDPTRATLPNVRWQEWIGLRNIIAHQYERISPARIWQIAADEVPALRAEVERELRARGE